MKAKVTWIVIADGNQAKVFEHDGPGKGLRALKDLYAWALRAGRIAANPFDEYNFDRPWLSRDEIRRREQALGSPQERELVRLRALNQLAEALHRSLDVR